MFGYPWNGWYQLVLFVTFGKQLRYLELFPDQHWSMSSYDPKERRKLATHAEGVPRFRQSDFELPSCLVFGMILGHLGWNQFPCKKARLDYTIFFANSCFMLLFSCWASWISWICHSHPYSPYFFQNGINPIKPLASRVPGTLLLWFAFSLPAHLP